MEDVKRDTYRMRMHCYNCGYKFTKEYPKGERCLMAEKCPHCLCNDAKAIS